MTKLLTGGQDPCLCLIAIGCAIKAWCSRVVLWCLQTVCCYRELVSSGLLRE